jgi:hypothetical protein
MDFRPVIFREGHEGEHIGLCFIHEGREFRHLRTQLIGDLAPLLAGGLGIVLNKGGADEGSDDTTALLGLGDRPVSWLLLLAALSQLIGIGLGLIGVSFDGLGFGNDFGRLCV